MNFAATLVLNSSTISVNGASSPMWVRGGGIFATGGNVTITNSTISGNYAISTGDGAYGGGLDLESVTQALLQNVTSSGNAASGDTETGGAALQATSNTTVRGSIFAKSNLSVNCAGSPALVDLGGNQADDTSCGTTPGTLTGLDPVLRDNGGPTLTHALPEGSTAISGAGACGLASDQRGAPRGVQCDAGAFEYGGCPEITLSDDTLLWPATYEFCQIYAGPNYAVAGPSGDLTLRFGREIDFNDGFSVDVDGVLTGIFDSSLILPLRRFHPFLWAGSGGEKGGTWACGLV